MICRFSVIDCQVSDWSDWSKCDVACGIGTLTRTREVLRPESNGGRQCPSLEESRSCRATRCSSRQLDKISALKGNKKYNNCNYKQNILAELIQEDFKIDIMAQRRVWTLNLWPWMCFKGHIFLHFATGRLWIWNW